MVLLQHLLDCRLRDQTTKPTPALACRQYIFFLEQEVRTIKFKIANNKIKSRTNCPARVFQ